ncbi:28S ribosomal protein S5, mitochondrial [Agrilus planipennis]|uniref:Small ribosomal subunit protein uS5m n=1 Tax=Agrilus planipennis TaxID=224129 RepID=A0A1W4WV11_AGRPL|nr:28S ribosomal protein S5, mitochondrial [Agrilus planipennis]
MSFCLRSINKTIQHTIATSRWNLYPILSQVKVFSSPKIIIGNSTRNTSFFNKLPADHLWKGITSVSNAGKKRGRGKTLARKKDLNRGQVLGLGKANMLWPGLSAPIIRGKELVERQQLPEDPEREKKLIQLRDKMGALKSYKLSPLERGWSGNKMPGRSIGPPDPIGEDKFEGFDTKVIEFKIVFNMKGNFGRKRRQSTFVVTGNKNGLAGFATGKAIDPKAALRKAKNRAGQKLMHIDIFRGHTVNHDFFTQFGATKIYVSQKPEGYGLVCHRAIKTVCEVIGIKNLYAKVEGSTNVQHIVKAFFLGLLRQKTHQEIANDKQLHLVEFSKDNEYYPKVLASPTVCRKADEIRHHEVMDFTQYCYDGRIVLKRKKFPIFYTKHKSWEVHLKKQEYLRNLDKTQTYLRAEYGELKSFLTEKYPECRPHKVPPKEKTSEEE